MLAEMALQTGTERAHAAGIPQSPLPGPFPVGSYAAKLREQLRSFKHVQLLGELVNLRVARTRVYFELRDASGAVPCAAWLSEWEKMPNTTGAELVAQRASQCAISRCDSICTTSAWGKAASPRQLRQPPRRGTTAMSPATKIGNVCLLSIPIAQDRPLLAMLRYLERNALRANLVTRVEG